MCSQEVAFKVDYTVPSIGREFGSVFLGDKNVAMLVVSGGWARVQYLSRLSENRDQVKL